MIRIIFEGEPKELAKFIAETSGIQTSANAVPEEENTPLGQTEKSDKHLEPCTRKSDYLFGMRVPGWPNDGYGE